MISVAVAAKLLMISERRIQQLVKAGWIARGPGDRYQTVVCVQGYLRFLKDESRNRSQSTARARIEASKAQMAELRYAEARGDLIAMTEAQEVFTAIIGALKSEVIGLPAAFIRRTDDRKRFMAERERLDLIIDGLLERTANKFAAWVANARKTETKEDNHADET